MEGLIARAYIRVSTEEQAVSGYSLMAQRERLEAFAQSQGWTVAKVYEDDGYSAKDTKRPALQQLLTDAQAGDVVLAYKLDRLTRSVMDLYELMHLFDKRGVLFKSATEEFNTTTSHGRLMITLVAVLAQWERETIAERVKMGRQKKASTGEWPGGPIPFGYKAAPGRAKAGRTLIRLVPDEERAHLVREIFERYLAGQGVRGLALWLSQELAVPAANGGTWRPVTLVRMLTNPVYCGDVVHGRRTGGPVTRVAGNHEGILPQGLFERVQDIFQKRKGLPPRHATGKYPLAGVARCGVCDGPISALWVAREGTYYYRCLRYVQGTGCGQPAVTSFPGLLAEAAVVQLIDGLRKPDRLDAFLQQCDEEWAAQAGYNAAEIKRSDSDLHEARSAIQRWHKAYETGKLAFDDYLARIAPHKDRIKTIETELARLRAIPVRLDHETLVSEASNFRLVWGLAEPPERKSLLLRVLPAFGARIILCRERKAALIPQESGCHQAGLWPLLS